MAQRFHTKSRRCDENWKPPANAMHDPNADDTEAVRQFAVRDLRKEQDRMDAK
jgi:hypothetical protein